MKKAIFTLTALLLISLLSQAQTFDQMRGGKRPADANTKDSKAQIGLYALYMSPRDNFADQLTNDAGGLGFNVLWRVEQSPLKIGFDINWLLYGIDRDRRPLSTTLPEFEVVIERYNNMLPMHFMAVLEPNKGMIRPYAETFAGFRFIWTNASIQGNQVVNVPGNPQSFSTSNLAFDANWSYGFGGGLKIVLAEKNAFDLTLNLGAKYMYGTTARYLTANDVKIDYANPTRPVVNYNYRNSTMNMFLIQAGVNFIF